MLLLLDGPLPGLLVPAAWLSGPGVRILVAHARRHRRPRVALYRLTDNESATARFAGWADESALSPFGQQLAAALGDATDDEIAGLIADLTEKASRRP